MPKLTSTLYCLMSVSLLCCLEAFAANYLFLGFPQDKASHWKNERLI